MVSAPWGSEVLSSGRVRATSSPGGAFVQLRGQHLSGHRLVHGGHLGSTEGHGWIVVPILSHAHAHTRTLDASVRHKRHTVCGNSRAGAMLNKGAWDPERPSPSHIWVLESGYAGEEPPCNSAGS